MNGELYGYIDVIMLEFGDDYVGVIYFFEVCFDELGVYCFIFEVEGVDIVGCVNLILV